MGGAARGEGGVEVGKGGGGEKGMNAGGEGVEQGPADVGRERGGG